MLGYIRIIFGVILDQYPNIGIIFGFYWGNKPRFLAVGALEIDFLHNQCPSSWIIEIQTPEGKAD